MPGTIMIFLLLLYVFALIGFFSFTFLSIFNFLLLMLDTLLHYLRNKKNKGEGKSLENTNHPSTPCSHRNNPKGSQIMWYLKDYCAFT